MSVLAAAVLMITTIALAVLGTAVFGRRPPRPARRGRSWERIQLMKQMAAEDVAAVRGESVVADPVRERVRAGRL